MKKKILFLSAYHADSHRYWAESLIAELDEFEWVLLPLPARFFSWRIRGNPLSFIHEFNDQLHQAYDLCLCTSMVDLATLKSLVPSLQGVPSITYFHENQFAYPTRGQQHRSLEPAMVNLYTALAADTVVFNSAFNQQSLLEGVDQIMHQMPDKAPLNLSRTIEAKSQVIPVPLHNNASSNTIEAAATKQCPQLTWNHRWEYDKDPELLLHILRQLDEQSMAFEVAIIGQQFRQQPNVFAKIKTLLDHSDCLMLKHWGYITSEQAYYACLSQTDIILSTALHDFQGLSILEGVLRGAIPVVPKRQVYPEWFEEEYLFDASGDMSEQASSAVLLIKKSINSPRCPDLSSLLWSSLRNQYRVLIERAMQ